MSFQPDTIRVGRDRAQVNELLADYGVRKGLQRWKEARGGNGYGYRRSLLSRTLRLTRSMSPEIADCVAECKALLGYEHNIEIFVTPDFAFNASCFRDDDGPTIITLSARLLEAFTPGELRFVIGHELGHAVFEHRALPMPLLAQIEDLGIPYVSRPVALRLYSWCRTAELSADRVGLICAGDAESAASGFFKLASGMSSSRVKPDLSTFAKQVESLASAPEARKKEYDDDSLDCFSTHPYNPVRVRAVWAFGKSDAFANLTGRKSEIILTLQQVEDMIEHDLGLMEPTYLQEKTPRADTLRRLLYTAGVAVAAAADGIEPAELEVLGKLLGAEFAEMPKDISKVLVDLDGRIKDALEVPEIYRAQLLQHLTLIAGADGKVQDEEMAVMEKIAIGLKVSPEIIHQTIAGAMNPID